MAVAPVLPQRAHHAPAVARVVLAQDGLDGGAGFLGGFSFPGSGGDMGPAPAAAATAVATPRPGVAAMWPGSCPGMEKRRGGGTEASSGAQWSWRWLAIMSR